MRSDAPANRARRLWLIQRLERSRRSLELLDHKRQLLRVEHRRLEMVARHTGDRWKDAADEARRWWMRATAVGGMADVALVTPPSTAEVDVTYNHIVGVRYPASATVTTAELDGVRQAAVSAATVRAVESARAALLAATEHAAARRADAIVETELRATERRHRAIEKHRIPELDGELRRLESRLEELERAQQMTSRWASDQSRVQRLGESEPGTRVHIRR